VRVLIVSPYLPARDGIADYSAALGGELRRQGHLVGVVSSSRGEAPGDVIATLPALTDRAGRARLATRVARDFDVVHVQFAVAAFGTTLPRVVLLIRALRGSCIPIVATMHEVTRDTELLRAVGRIGYQRMAELVDWIIVHTEPAHHRLVQELATKTPVQIIRQPAARAPTAGVEPEVLRARYELSDATVLLAFGFLTVDKGLDVFVEALAQLQPASELRVVVAGGVRTRRGLFRVFELRDRLHVFRVRLRARQLGIDRMMTFTGYVPDEEVATWFNLANAAVLPYRRIEDSGVAAMAAAAGTRLLVSDAGELHRIYDSISFAAGDPDALARALKQFRSEAGAGGVETRPASCASPSQVADETATLYGLAITAGQHLNA
jgi:glycosyltransferase involved in cell wall biosynthesis